MLTAGVGADMTDGQLPIFITGYGGIEVGLHHRSTDPVTSKASARRAVQESAQSEASQALYVLTRFGPGTTRELAEQAGVPDPKEFHHLLARRFVDLERKEKVTCDRVKDERGKTVSATTKVCGVTGQTMLEWRVWR